MIRDEKIVEEIDLSEVVFSPSQLKFGGDERLFDAASYVSFCFPN